MIDLIDENGYFKGETDDVAVQLGCALTMTVDEVSSFDYSGFDPPGVFAPVRSRNAWRCSFAISNRSRPGRWRHFPGSISICWPKGEVAELHKICGVLPDDIPAMIAEIKALNPKPGQGFAEAPIDADGTRHLHPATGQWLARRAELGHLAQADRQQ